jgi:hypothetical protein
MATMRQEVWIDRNPTDVWEVVGDPAAVTSWFPGMLRVEMDGTKRTLHLGSGLHLDETVVTVRHDLRRFQYRLEGPLPVEHHLASIDVIADEDDDGRCVVVYSTDVEPHALAPVLDGAVGDALASLKQLMEATRTNGTGAR